MKHDLVDDLDRAHRRWRGKCPSDERQPSDFDCTGRVPMHLAWGWGPNFDWNLASRILRSRVGRPWNEVHSEIAAVLSARGPRAAEVRERLCDLVGDREAAFVAERAAGEPSADMNDRSPRHDYRWAEFRVCSETGRLQIRGRRRRRGHDREGRQGGDERVPSREERRAPQAHRRAPRGKRSFRARR